MRKGKGGRERERVRERGRESEREGGKTEEGLFPSGSYGGRPVTLGWPGGHVTLPQVRWGWGRPSPEPLPPQPSPLSSGLTDLAPSAPPAKAAGNSQWPLLQVGVAAVSPPLPASSWPRAPSRTQRFAHSIHRMAARAGGSAQPPGTVWGAGRVESLQPLPPAGPPHSCFCSPERAVRPGLLQPQTRA